MFFKRNVPVLLASMSVAFLVFLILTCLIGSVFTALPAMLDGLK